MGIFTSRYFKTNVLYSCLIIIMLLFKIEIFYFITMTQCYVLKPSANHVTLRLHNDDDEAVFDMVIH